MIKRSIQISVVSKKKFYKTERKKSIDRFCFYFIAIDLFQRVRFRSQNLFDEGCPSNSPGWQKEIFIK